MAKHHLQEVAKHLGTIPANVPAHRKAARHVYTFSDGSFDEQLAVWDQIWKNTRQTQAYLLKHIRDVSPIAFTIAIEKVGDKERDKLKALRKKG